MSDRKERIRNLDKFRRNIVAPSKIDNENE